MVCLGLYIDHG
jgi:hypothetical protein